MEDYRYSRFEHSSRNFVIDLLRSIAMLWIVCVWHLLGYSPKYSISESYPCHIITVFFLCMFFFLSGYLLSRKYKTGGNGLSSAMGFYKRRILRVLPLFALSCFSFPNKSSVLDRLLCLSGFSTFMVNRQLPTLWFISMLMLFYLLLPVFAPCKVSKQLIAFTFVFLIVLGIDKSNVFASWGGVDKRFYIYFSSFTLGTILSRKDLFSNNAVPSNISKPIGFLSYISFCVYLFHRHVLTAFELFYLPKDGLIRVVFLYCVCVPIIFILSYLIQRAYDRVLKRL